MKNILSLLALLLCMLSFATTGKAQKAYEEVIYKAKVLNYNASLLWGDGYMGASEVHLYVKTDKQDPDKFYPRSGQADEKGQLFFQSIKENDSRAFRLLNISDTMALPSTISARFFDGRTWLPVSFKLTQRKK